MANGHCMPPLGLHACMIYSQANGQLENITSPAAHKMDNRCNRGIKSLKVTIMEPGTKPNSEQSARNENCFSANYMLSYDTY